MQSSTAFILSKSEPKITSLLLRRFTTKRFPLRGVHQQQLSFIKREVLYRAFFIQRISYHTKLLTEQQHPLRDNIEPITKEGEDVQRKVELFKVLKFLLFKGCSTSDIREKCAPYIKSDNNSYLKALLISELDSDIVTLLPLMCLGLKTLRAAARNCRDEKSSIEGFASRIAYLCHHLDLPFGELVQSLTKHPSLLTMKFQRLEQKMNILKDAGISSRYIAKDLWIFNYHEKLFVKRVSAAEEASVDLKPWMLRASEKTFKSVIKKFSETNRILQGENEIDYLARRLDCNRNYINYITMEKNKLIMTIGIPKLEQILDFLFEKGYTPQEIRLFPRVFCSSIHTLNTRFNEFCKIRSTLPTIPQLCVSSDRFRRIQRKKNKS